VERNPGADRKLMHQDDINNNDATENTPIK
jgi:hypothetical protein